MVIQVGYLVVVLAFLVQLFTGTTKAANTTPPDHVYAPFNRTSFTPGFVFGTASSAYQYEGAAKEDGKGPNIWDTFTHKYQGTILDLSNGDVAVDFYHRYKEDVKLMKFLGMDGFRLSISWARVLPSGKLSGGVNRKGIDFYNNLINELLLKGIQPYVTIFHWDLPQALEDKYRGFLSPKIVDDFRDFAELCFKEFGDRVKHWITLNEPWSYVYGAYDVGQLAPAKCSSYSGPCQPGNPATEPYIASHNLLLSHGAAVKVYKEKYQATQKGKIGITLNSHWMVPYSNSKADQAAAQRALDFMLGWFLHPLTYGYYPKNMRTIVGKRLPKFTPEQAKLLKGSLDFVGLNYYTAYYIRSTPANTVNVSYSNDQRAEQLVERNGTKIGRPTGSPVLFMNPKGFRDLLVYTKEKYMNPDIYITECGMVDAYNGTATAKEGVKDQERIYFYNQHLLSLQDAKKAGVKVKGFFAWSFLDNFEWRAGFAQRFGIVFIDYNNGLKRVPKLSAYWFKKFLLA